MAGKTPKRVVAVLGARFGDLKIEEKLLRRYDVDLVAGDGLDEDETARLCRSTSVILAGGAPKLPASLLRRLPELRAIVRYGIGVDTVDLDEATRRGICVANVPDYCIEEVATHALALILAWSRKLPLAERLTRGGKWAVAPLMPMESSRDLLLGVVGFGRIARRLARMARALGFQVAASDPYVKKTAMQKHRVRPLSFDRLVRTADFISLHLPLSPKTGHLMNERTIGRMKPTAYLINTARGGLIDEASLYRALRDRKIAGAALDVLEEEPWPDNSPLRELDNLIVTPHAAWYTARAQRELRVKACAEVIRVLSGKRPKNLVNRGVLR
ncbi:MAG TPA: C-terminal binding protein [Verrucomicrobiae bacterium]|jgi:D-3-phosphoglycerate dehydrogenase / 2-oxoglutarate reductase|nr:C-terminal binding protein [Verrucomicrobiae bacterium]